jgi:hypothetical protein
MANDLVPYHAARNELQDILDAGAKALKGPGLDLMPIKRDMLRLDDATADLVLDACNLLFAACLSYEGAQWQIKTATNAVELVTARIDAGRAIGVVESLFYGPTRDLIWLAMDRAPIAFYALSEASPALRIIERLRGPANPTLKDP